MKKLNLLCLLFLFGISSISAQILSICGPAFQPSDLSVEVTVSGGTGPYTWFNKRPCGDVTTEAECNLSDSCFWMFGQCLVGGGGGENWVGLATGITISYALNSGETKVVDALGNELIFNGAATTTCAALGIEKNSLFRNVSIFPNPNKGIVNINFGDLKNVDLKIFNTIGKLMYHKENIIETIHQFELKGASGLYFMELSSQQGKQSYKLHKN